MNSPGTIGSVNRVNTIRHWPASLRWSLPWHAAMALGCAAAPEQWPLWVAGLAANHALLTGAGLTPRSNLLGPNITRLSDPARQAGVICLTFDDGPDPAVTPIVLALLAQYGFTASFFCIGRHLQAHSGLAQQIVQAGHSIENHTQQHRHNFSFLGSAGFRREIAAAQASVAAVAGVAPRFFRAPAGMRNPLLQPVLSEMGLQLTSWTRRGFDTREKDPDLVYQRLTRNLAAADILLLHDGHAAKTSRGQPVILEVLPRLLARIREERLRALSLPQAFAL